MKKCLTCILTLIILLSLSVPSLATEDIQNEAYEILVNDQPLDLSDLPLAPYKEDDTVMVPLRKIGEALGYTVGWNSATGEITIDDNYIQKATLLNGTATVVFERKLQVINMSREIENAVPTIIHYGYTYVPLEFFQEFFNDTVIEGTAIMIAPSKSELAEQD